MATIQLGRTKSASKLISYCEKRAVEVSGVNCPSEYARSQFQATRELWGKSDGVQAHHIIQSFKPGEVSPQQANEIGKDLAEKIAKGHEVTVYTHADKGHIHNHIVINSVNFENGKKYQAHGKDAIEKVREVSDKLCQDKNLSIIKEPYAKIRYTLTEKNLLEKGEESWKDQLRDAIDISKKETSNFKDFINHLKENFNIDTRVGKYITYKHPDNPNWKSRCNNLGLGYTKGEIENEFSRKVESREGQERGHTDLSSRAEKPKGTGRADERDNQHQSGIKQGVSADKGTNRTDGGLHKGTYEGRNSSSNNSRQRVAEDKGHDKLDYNKAREKARELQIGVGRSHDKLQKGEQSHNPNSTRGNEQNRQQGSKGVRGNQGLELSIPSPIEKGGLDR